MNVANFKEYDDWLNDVIYHGQERFSMTEEEFRNFFEEYDEELREIYEESADYEDALYFIRVNISDDDEDDEDEIEEEFAKQWAEDHEDDEYDVGYEDDSDDLDVHLWWEEEDTR